MAEGEPSRYVAEAGKMRLDSKLTTLDQGADYLQKMLSGSPYCLFNPKGEFMFFSGAKQPTEILAFNGAQFYSSITAGPTLTVLKRALTTGEAADAELLAGQGLYLFQREHISEEVAKQLNIAVAGMLTGASIGQADVTPDAIAQRAHDITQGLMPTQQVITEEAITITSTPAAHDELRSDEQKEDLYTTDEPFILLGKLLQAMDSIDAVRMILAGTTDNDTVKFFIRKWAKPRFDFVNNLRIANRSGLLRPKAHHFFPIISDLATKQLVSNNNLIFEDRSGGTRLTEVSIGALFLHALYINQEENKNRLSSKNLENLFVTFLPQIVQHYKNVNNPAQITQNIISVLIRSDLISNFLDVTEKGKRIFENIIKPLESEIETYQNRPGYFAAFEEAAKAS